MENKRNNLSVSIIVPVYNAARYLSACLDSVLAQDYDNWDAILIDDGSTDGSRAIMDTYHSLDKRFKCISKNNGGVSSARNIGLEQSAGEWALFLDADDCLKPNALSMLVGKAEGLDFVFGGYEILNDEGVLTYSVPERIECTINESQAFEQLFKPWHYRAFGAAWGKLFKLSVIKKNSLKFNERIHIGEDRLFVFDFVCHANSGYYFTIPVYEYYERPGSAMDTFNKGENKHFLTDLDAFMEMKRHIAAHQLKEEVLPLLKYGVKCNFHILSQSNKSNGWKWLVFKVRTHWKLLRILSLKDYCQDVVLPHIPSIGHNTV